MQRKREPSVTETACVDLDLVVCKERPGGGEAVPRGERGETDREERGAEHTERREQKMQRKREPSVTETASVDLDLVVCKERSGWRKGCTERREKLNRQSGERGESRKCSGNESRA
jgi:hypothetical protein